MRYLIYSLVIIIALLLQITIFAFHPLWGVTPDILLIVVISWALLRGYREGAYLGFLAGILQELFTSGIFGVNIITKLIFGYIFGFLKGKVYSKSVLIPSCIIVIATFLNQLLIIGLMNNFMVQTALWMRFKEIILPMMGYHTLLSLFIYPAIYVVNQRYL